MDEVSPTELLKSAREFLRRSLSAYTTDDAEMILPMAGIGLEHACKAHLAGLHPSLIVEPGNGAFDHLLRVLGNPHAAKGHLRTVGGYEALRRVRQVLPAVKALPEAPAKEVLDARSGTLHLGSHDQTEMRERLGAVLRICAAIFDAMSVPEEDRWGEHDAVVASLVDETAQLAKREVARRVAGAKARYSTLVASFPTQQAFEIARPTLEARWVRLWSEAGSRGRWPCPACGSEGQVGGSVDYADPSQNDHGEDDEPIWARELVITTFVCPVCQLQLNGAEQLEAVGLDTTAEWESTAEPPPTYWDYEPDEDWVRGR